MKLITYKFISYIKNKLTSLDSSFARLRKQPICNRFATCRSFWKWLRTIHRFWPKKWSANVAGTSAFCSKGLHKKYAGCFWTAIPRWLEEVFWLQHKYGERSQRGKEKWWKHAISSILNNYYYSLTITNVSPFASFSSTIFLEIVPQILGFSKCRSLHSSFPPLSEMKVFP